MVVIRHRLDILCLGGIEPDAGRFQIGGQAGASGLPVRRRWAKPARFAAHRAQRSRGSEVGLLPENLAARPLDYRRADTASVLGAHPEFVARVDISRATVL